MAVWSFIFILKTSKNTMLSTETKKAMRKLFWGSQGLLFVFVKFEKLLGIPRGNLGGKTKQEYD